MTDKPHTEAGTEAPLGLPGAWAHGIAPLLAKLVDKTSEEWIARFNASPHAQTV